jgi:hypothetical protein
MDPKTQLYIEISKLAVSIVGLGGTFIAAVVAVVTFRRAEKWKRAEFLAREMKEFFADIRVQNALTLIDWGSRYVKLLDDGTPSKGRVLVDRRMQVRALLPHVLLPICVDAAGADSADSEVGRYTPPEAAIRDCYDAFLDGLERISSYVQTGLIDLDSLRPYLQYWIDDIHSPLKNEEDAAWSASLWTFIAFYRFSGVQWLFRAFDRDIVPTCPEFNTLLARMNDPSLAENLAKAVKSTK